MIEQKDTLLYFLSTVPQVLGAMLALIGVFQVLNMDLLRKKVFSMSQQIIDNWNNNNWNTQLRKDMQDLDDINLYHKFRGDIESIRRSQIGHDLKDLSRYSKNIIELAKEKEETLTSPTALDLWWNCIRIHDELGFINLHRRVTIRLFGLNGIIIFLFILGFYFVPFIVMVKTVYQIIFKTSQLGYLFRNFD